MVSSSVPVPGELLAALGHARSRIAPFGCAVHYFHETGSTNDVAARLAERGVPEGTLVIASAQTAGRGRLGRAWYSPPDAGLYVSAICRNRAAAPLLTLAGGIAVAEGVRSATALPVEIKWPNDVVICSGSASTRRRKLAGILAEGASSSHKLEYVVVGLGLNLRRAAYPPDITERATSLEAELGRPVDGWPLLIAILTALSSCFSDLVSGNAAAVLERWRALAPSAVGTRIEWESDGGRRQGVTAGVAEDGALLVRAGAEAARIVAGEIFWRD